MSAIFRRSSLAVVCTLVMALMFPVAAGADVPVPGTAITHEGPAPATPHETPAGSGGLTDRDLTDPEEALWEPVEVEVPAPDDATGGDLADAVRDEVDETLGALLEDAADGSEHGVEGGALDERGLDEVVDEEARDAPVVTGRATHIAVGYRHSLHLDDEGKIWAWGRNANGQLGDGTTVDSSVPVRVDMSGVLAGVEVVAVAAGGHYSMALGADGRVYTWGRNSEGGLGDGTTTNRTTPVRVEGLLADQRVVQIAGGAGLSNDGGIFSSSLAVVEDGRVYTWGSGNVGRLGNGTTSGIQRTPALVGGAIAGLEVVGAAVGFDHTLVLTSDGRLFTWGHRLHGAMGSGSTSGSQTVPLAVPLTGVLNGVQVVQVEVGNHTSYVLGDEGEVFAWGRGTSGELGRGSTASSTAPVRADMAAFEAIGNRPSTIVAGRIFGMTLGENGRVAAWGGGGLGQLGNGASTNQTRAVEVDVDGVMADATIVQLASRYRHTLALTDDGRIFTWGEGADGKLGDGGTSGSNVPVQAGGLRVATEPADVSVARDAPGTFTTASAGVPATVHWERSVDEGRSWETIEGATAPSYTTPPATLEMGGHQYRAVFTSLSDFPSARGLVVRSRAATLTVDGPPIIIVHPPERVRSLAGLDVVLEADADGAQPMTVQWQSSADGDAWDDVPGATARTYAFTAAEGLDGRLFRAVFANPSGTAATNPALLEVVVAAPGAHLSVTPTVRHVVGRGSLET